MRDEVVRMAAETPTVGPEQQIVTVVSGDSRLERGGQRNAAETVRSRRAGPPNRDFAPRHGARGVRQQRERHEEDDRGRQMTVISFTDQGKHKVVAYANDQNAIERVESSYGHPSSAT